MLPLQRLGRQPALVVLPLLCIVAWLHARAVSSWTATLLGASPARDSSGPAPARSFPPLSPRSGQPILARNPFDSVTGPLVRNAAPSGESPRNAPESWPDCPAELRVIAIAAADARASLAVFRPAAGGPTHTASLLRREGDPLGSGRVVRIARDRVFLQDANGPCQMRIAGPRSADGGPKRSPDEPAHPAPGVRQVGEGAFEVDRTELESALSNPGRMSHVRVVPESVEGRQVGLRLFGIRQDDPLAALGLRNGDRVESINGYDLTDPEAMLAAYARLRSAESFSLRLNRGGAPVGIDVKVR